MKTPPCHFCVPSYLSPLSSLPNPRPMRLIPSSTLPIPVHLLHMRSNILPSSHPLPLLLFLPSLLSKTPSPICPLATPSHLAATSKEWIPGLSAISNSIFAAYRRSTCTGMQRFLNDFRSPYLSLTVCISTCISLSLSQQSCLRADDTSVV